MALKIGTLVQWTSQSAGYTKTKTGKIIKVVPKNKSPYDVLTSSILSQHKVNGEFGMDRDHVSYLISVPGKNGKTKPILMWPLVDKLKVVD